MVSLLLSNLPKWGIIPSKYDKIPSKLLNEFSVKIASPANWYERFQAVIINA